MHFANDFGSDAEQDFIGDGDNDVEKETKIIHIRPHGQNSKDRDEDNFGTSVIKQSFWLNKKFVKKLVIDSLNE